MVPALPVIIRNKIKMDKIDNTVQCTVKKRQSIFTERGLEIRILLQLHFLMIRLHCKMRFLYYNPFFSPFKGYDGCKKIRILVLTDKNVSFPQ